MEQRLFNRVEFDAEAFLSGEGFEYPCQVIDLSLHGALLRLDHKHTINRNMSLVLRLPLGTESENIIAMQLKLVARQDDLVHLVCKHIDLDSLTHLRRLVELNTGHPELLERELASLCE